MTQVTGTIEHITYSELPLAIYCEVAAHLRQVKGVKTELIPQVCLPFNYNQSQVSGLWIEYEADLDTACHKQVEEILDYYAQRYNPYQRKNIN